MDDVFGNLNSVRKLIESKAYDDTVVVVWPNGATETKLYGNLVY